VSKVERLNHHTATNHVGNGLYMKNALEY